LRRWFSSSADSWITGIGLRMGVPSVTTDRDGVLEGYPHYAVYTRLNGMTKYFDLLQPQTPSASGQKEGRHDDSRTDKNGHSHKVQERTKMTIAYRKENKKKENKNNVNEDRPKTAIRKSTGMTSLGDISLHFDIDKYRLVKKPAKPLTEDERAKRDYYAQTIAEELNDQKSLGAFRVIAQTFRKTLFSKPLAVSKRLHGMGKSGRVGEGCL
jgi:hypothetical protein